MTNAITRMKDAAMIEYLKGRPDELAAYKEQTEKDMREWWGSVLFFVGGLVAAILLVCLMRYLSGTFDDEYIASMPEKIIVSVIFGCIWSALIYRIHRKVYNKRLDIARQAEWGY